MGATYMGPDCISAFTEHCHQLGTTSLDVVHSLLIAFLSALHEVVCLCCCMCDCELAVLEPCRGWAHILLPQLSYESLEFKRRVPYRRSNLYDRWRWSSGAFTGDAYVREKDLRDGLVQAGRG